MKWKKFTLKTTTEAVDLISYTLDELGIEGIEIEDNIPLTEKETKGMFIDILPELPPDEGVAKVSFYLDEDDDIPAMMAKVKEALEELKPFTDLGACTFAESETEDKDWINNWKQYFKPFTVDHILIKPTWETVPEEHKDKLLIQIDPGTAFGTGKHETTQLCIRQLEKYVKPGVRILDLGTGSGILAIAARALGAGRVDAMDYDDVAVWAAVQNAARNNSQLMIYKSDLLRGCVGEADLIIANIVADVILRLVPDLRSHLKPNGRFLCSGVLLTRAADVREALSVAGFAVVEQREDGEWCAILAEMKEEEA